MADTLMKRTQWVAVLLLTTILMIGLAASPATNAAAPQRFVIEEYQLFYELLNPLLRGALPEGDFQRIRSSANELVARGKAIVKLRVHENRKFAEARRKFDRALDAFMIDARKDDNPRLVKSFTAAHDSFEELADIAPTAYWSHLTAVTCSSGNPEPGNQLVFRADATRNFDAEKQRFFWTITGGKIVDGQGTRTLTIDTTGLAGQKIMVQVEVDDGNQHKMYTSCDVQITTSKQP
jgi:hypothetical protein